LQNLRFRNICQVFHSGMPGAAPPYILLGHWKIIFFLTNY